MLDTARDWAQRDPDPNTAREITELIDARDETTLAPLFDGRLTFGTAGLRAAVGPGPKRMNQLVVEQTTAGLARTFLSQVSSAAERGVIVGFDARPASQRFAEAAAAVFAAHGMRVHLFDRPVPTPLAAFALTHLNAAGAVVVTASHNPPEYNGYKVFWETGGQIVPPHDATIAAAIEAVAAEAPLSPPTEQQRQQIASVPASVRQQYLEATARLATGATDITLAYTPLHGVGRDLVCEALSAAGFEHPHVVPSQAEPDGTFPTVAFPNPEEPGAMDALLTLAEDVGADLALANDPDADRLAVAVRDGDGYRVLTGNEIGALLADQALRRRMGGLVGTTVVSSRLLQKLARYYDVTYFETLTGLKWISHGGLSLRGPDQPLVFGYEEALGYMIGDTVLDKDGVSALVAFASLGADLKAHGASVLDRLAEVYQAVGVHVSTQRVIPLDQDPELVTRLRQDPPAAIGGRTVHDAIDLTTDDGRARCGAALSPVPAANVLIYQLDGARIAVRPSGTEPKIKCYYEVFGQPGVADVGAEEARLKAELADLAHAHQGTFE